MDSLLKGGVRSLRHHDNFVSWRDGINSLDLANNRTMAGSLIGSAATRASETQCLFMPSYVMSQGIETTRKMGSTRTLFEKKKKKELSATKNSPGSHGPLPPPPSPLQCYHNIDLGVSQPKLNQAFPGIRNG